MRRIDGLVLDISSKVCAQFEKGEDLDIEQAINNWELSRRERIILSHYALQLRDTLEKHTARYERFIEQTEPHIERAGLTTGFCGYTAAWTLTYSATKNVYLSIAAGAAVSITASHFLARRIAGLTAGEDYVSPHPPICEIVKRATKNLERAEEYSKT